jgi:hypothetical protein
MKKTSALMRTLDDIRAKCLIDPVTRCWNWTGSKSQDGMPRIWAFSHSHGAKNYMPGTRAVWNIAHDRAPLPGWFIIRACGNTSCLNPVHLKELRSRKEIGKHVRRAGWLVGNSTEQRRATIKLAFAASGAVQTAPETVIKIHQEPAEVSSAEVARKYGVSRTIVSRIRLGKSYRQLLAPIAGSQALPAE